MSSSNPEKQHKKQAGRWSEEEHQRFMLGVFQHGKDWKKVEQVVGTRSGAQVRSHAQKFFNKLQKNQKQVKTKQEHKDPDISDTENDFLKGIVQQEQSIYTPIELVSLIRKQSRDNKGVNVDDFKKVLVNQQKELDKKVGVKKQQEQNLVKLRKEKQSYSSMNNILSAYQNLYDQKNKEFADQSFLIQLTKRYKRFFSKGGKFENLIDFGNPGELIKVQKSLRKKSFTLLEGEQSDDEKLQEIKKKIKAEDLDENKKQLHLPQNDNNNKQPIQKDKESQKIADKKYQNNQKQSKQVK